MKIEVSNLSKSFKKEKVLNNVNLTMESGNIYGLYGINGSGKSVFLKLLCGLYLPDAGEIKYDDKVLNKDLKYPKDVGAFIERPSFLPNLTGLENLKLLSNIEKKIGIDDILNALKIVNLTDEMNKKYSKYSVGMKQKLAIASSIMEDKKVIILDEPFSGIDASSKEKIINYLLKEKEKGKIIIISTHIKEELDLLVDAIYNFDSGVVTIKKAI